MFENPCTRGLGKILGASSILPFRGGANGGGQIKLPKMAQGPRSQRQSVSVHLCCAHALYTWAFGQVLVHPPTTSTGHTHRAPCNTNYTCSYSFPTSEKVLMQRRMSSTRYSCHTPPTGRACLTGCSTQITFSLVSKHAFKRAGG